MTLSRCCLTKYVLIFNSKRRHNTLTSPAINISPTSLKFFWLHDYVLITDMATLPRMPLHSPVLTVLDQRLIPKTKRRKRKGNHLHLLRKANIYFKLQYKLFNHKKKEKNSDLTVVTSCAKKLEITKMVIQGSWAAYTAGKGNTVAEIWHSCESTSKPNRMPLKWLNLFVY